MDSRGGAGRSCAAPAPRPPGQPAEEARLAPREHAVPVAERPAEPARPTAPPVAWRAPPAAGREPERHAALEEVPRALARRGARVLQEAPGVGERNRGPLEQRVPAGLLRQGAPVPRRATGAPLRTRHSPETRCCRPRTGRAPPPPGPWTDRRGTPSRTTDR